MIEWLFLITLNEHFSIFHGEKQDYIRADDDDVRFVLAQDAKSCLYSASSLK
jgi:hypothetical protein